MNQSVKFSLAGRVGAVAVFGLAATFVVAGLAAGWFPPGIVARAASPTPSGFVTTTYVNLTIAANGTNGLDQASPANFSFAHGERVILTITNFDTGVNPTIPMWGRVMGTLAGTESVSVGLTGSPSIVTYVPQSELSHTLTIARASFFGTGSIMDGSGWGGMFSPNTPSGVPGMMGGGGMGGSSGSNCQSPSSGGMMGGSMGSGSGGCPGMGGSGGMGMGGGSWGSMGALMGGMMVNVPIPAAQSNSTPSVVIASFTLSTPGNFEWHCLAPCDPVAMSTPGYMRGSVTVT